MSSSYIYKPETMVIVIQVANAKNHVTKKFSSERLSH